MVFLATLRVNAEPARQVTPCRQVQILEVGSRQHRSVTAGKWLALRLGFRVLGLRFELLGSCLTRGITSCAWNAPQTFPCGLNKQLRAAADKGNPIVESKRKHCEGLKISGHMMISVQCRECESDDQPG